MTGNLNLGVHILAELRQCDRSKMEDHQLLKRVVSEALKASNFTEVDSLAYEFTPFGLTLVSVLSESHLSIHTYPEFQHMCVDVFHCRDEVEPCLKVVQHLAEMMGAQEVNTIDVARREVSYVMNQNFRVSETGFGVRISFEIDNILYSKRSKYQTIMVCENQVFGKLLFLDNEMQVSSSDWREYSRALMTAQKAQGDVLILGCGDGGLARSAYEQGFATATICEIDEEVTKAVKLHMPEICGDVFEDQRTTAIYDDAFKFVAETDRKFDGVIYDLTTTPIDHGQDRKTFLRDLCASLDRIMKPGAVLTMQCCSSYDKKKLAIIQEALELYFDEVQLKSEIVPAFVEPWTFASAVSR